MLVSLHGDHHLPHVPQKQLCLRQCQPRIAEAASRLDVHDVDNPCQAINPGFDQPQNPSLASNQSARLIGFALISHILDSPVEESRFAGILVRDDGGAGRMQPFIAIGAIEVPVRVD